MRQSLKFMGFAGPIVILISAILYIVFPSYNLPIGILFTLGVIMLTLNRFIGTESDFSRSKDKTKNLTLRRLYRQRCVGVLVLYISCVILFMHEGFYYGVYFRRINWLIPFIVFTVIELYTAFRIPAVEAKSAKG